jgi:hypothetical protein
VKRPACLGYNFRNVRISSVVFVILLAANVSLADETSFSRVRVPDLKGKQAKAVLTFSDQDKAVEIRPAKHEAVTIPFAQIDKCSYEFTTRHRVNEGTIATAPVGVGAVIMLTKSRSHWLEIDYHDQDARRAFVVRMDKRDYLKILDALKSHTGIDAEILGNARKR